MAGVRGASWDFPICEVFGLYMDAVVLFGVDTLEDVVSTVL